MAGGGVVEQERPRCRCHGEEMSWGRDATRRGGGRWRCTIKSREAQVRHAQTEKRRASRARYDKTEKGLASSARYRLSEKGRATQARANASRSALRVYAGATYLGLADTPEQAAAINAVVRNMLTDFKERR